MTILYLFLPGLALIVCLYLPCYALIGFFEADGDNKVKVNLYNVEEYMKGGARGYCMYIGAHNPGVSRVSAFVNINFAIGGKDVE